MPVLPRKKADKPCPRCYSPMVQDPGATDGWSCVKHGPPGSNGPIPAPPLPVPPANQNGAPMSPTANGAMTRDELLAAMKTWAKEHAGQPPTTKSDPALFSAAIRIFGRWNAAIEAAGLEPRPQGPPRGKTPTPAAPLPDPPPQPEVEKPEDPEPEQASPVGPDPEPVEESEPAPVAEAPPEADDEPPAPDFVDLAHELQEAFNEYNHAVERLDAASKPFLKHPVFEHLWELYWDGDWDPKEQTYKKHGPLEHLRVAVALLEKKTQP